MAPKKDKKKKAKKPPVTQRQTVIVNVGDRRRKAARKPRAKKAAMGGDFGTGGVSIIPSNMIRMNAPPQPLPLQPMLPMIEPVKSAGDYSLLENRLQGVAADVGRITDVAQDFMRQQREREQQTGVKIQVLEDEVKKVRKERSDKGKKRGRRDKGSLAQDMENI